MKKFTVISSLLFSLCILESVNTLRASNEFFEEVRDGFYAISLSSHQREHPESSSESSSTSLSVSPSISPNISPSVSLDGSSKSPRSLNKPYEYVRYVKDNIHDLSSSNKEQDNLKPHSMISKIAEDLILIPISTIALGTEVIFNVFGGPAAFWGVANAYSMIDDENREAFRIASMAIGGISLTRYVILNIMNPNKYKSYVKNYDEVTMFGRFTKSVDDPMSYFKMFGTNLVKKFISTPDTSKTSKESI